MYPGLHATRTPDKAAVIDAETGETVTYAELDSASTRFARWLGQRGLRRGDHIAVVPVNDITVFELYWAAVRSGLYVTFVNSHLAPDEVAYIVNDCDAKVVVVSGELASIGAKILDKTPRVVERLCFGGALPGHLDYADVVAATSDAPLADEPRGSDMLYSSGTTGQPKGIKTPLPDLQIGDPPGDPRMVLLRDRFAGDENVVFYTPAPIYHSAPLRYTTATQALGGTVVMTRQFDAETALATIDRFGVTHSQWVPTHFVRMLRLPNEVRARYNPASMVCALHVGAPCSVEVKLAMIDWWGPILYEYYSATESIGTTMITTEEWLTKQGSVGQSGPNSKGIVHICGSDGEALAPYEVGHIYFENDDWQFNYHNDPEKTAAARHPAHATWSTTGDIGYLDDDNYLFLTDRAKFMIISGGVNIYPQEIENCLSMHPEILDVAVIGVPDEEMGQSVHAVVQAMPGVTVGEELEARIIAHCRDRIAHYKCPRSVRFVDELPRTPAGKLVKSALN